jgi:hypothetical protein
VTASGASSVGTTSETSEGMLSQSKLRQYLHKSQEYRAGQTILTSSENSFPQSSSTFGLS